MNVVELLERALANARSLDYRIREEYLAGSEGGLCEFGGQRWIFLDPSLSHFEQLQVVMQILKNDVRFQTEKNRAA